jgi:hypothetical protein
MLEKADFFLTRNKYSEKLPPSIRAISGKDKLLKPGLKGWRC